jgi:hypothetical protein
MATPWSKREVLATLAVFAATLIVLTTFFVWPGIAVPGCRFYSGPVESINDRTYCYANIPPGADYFPGSEGWTHYYVNTTLWGFTFVLYAPPGPGRCSHLSINVTEPSGAVESGSSVGCVALGGRPPVLWFAADNESGVATGLNPGNFTLFVEQR